MSPATDKQNLSRVFWDTDVKQIDFDKQGNFVILRILEHGHLEDVKWLLKKYPTKTIKKAICQSRNLSEKTANFWAQYFNIPQKEILCLNKRYRQKRKQFWPY